PADVEDADHGALDDAGEHQPGAERGRRPVSVAVEPLLEQGGDGDLVEDAGAVDVEEVRPGEDAGAQRGRDERKGQLGEPEPALPRPKPGGAGSGAVECHVFSDQGMVPVARCRFSSHTGTSAPSWLRKVTSTPRRKPLQRNS